MEHLRLFRTAYNFQPDVDILPEVNNLPSCVEPDLSMSIRDIIYRMSQGIPSGSSPVWYPDDEDELPFDQSGARDLTDYTYEYARLQSDIEQRRLDELAEQTRTEEANVKEKLLPSEGGTTE